MKHSLVLSLLAVSSITPAAYAQDYQPDNLGPDAEEAMPGDSWSLSLGVGGIYVPEYTGSDDMEFKVLPLFDYRYQMDERSKVYVSTFQGIGYEYQMDSWQWGVKANYRGGWDDTDDPLLNGLDDADSTAELGPYARYSLNPYYSVGVELMAGLSDNNDGVEGKIDLGYRTRLNERTMVTSDVFLKFAGEDYLTQNFGVPAAKANSQRAAFAPDAGFTQAGVGGRVMYNFDQHNSVYVGGNVSTLLGDAADSPLTQEEVQIFGLLGYAYRF